MKISRRLRSLSKKTKYKDKNDFEWLVSRVENGFLVRFLGIDYFKEDRFCFDLPNGEYIEIKNTNCLFFNTPDFDTYYEVRELIKNEFTDDIWEAFEEMLEERLLHDTGRLLSEIC